MHKWFASIKFMTPFDSTFGGFVLHIALKRCYYIQSEVHILKKFLSLALTLLMLLGVFTACGNSKTQTDVPSPSQSAGSPTVSSESPSKDEPTPSTSSPTPTPGPAVLPSASTLVGTKHLPNIVDNQGSIGCCTSEGVTYTQFTVAVSQYINSLNPDSDWNPSSGDKKYLFAPKFTYNFSGSGTGYCYKVLRDNGALPMSFGDFYKSPSTSPKAWGGSVLNHDQSRAWMVEKDMMLNALNYRLNNFEEIEYTSTNGGQLTTNEAGQNLLYKIKEAIHKGNAVAVCGWSSFWQYTTIDNNGLGTLGKKGDSAIWTGYKASNSDSDGNHCVAIVGYDDDITVTRAGVTMKGAFLVRNSWGDWKNDGHVWLMYDACNNKTSEYALFNDAYFYKATTALALNYMKMATPYTANAKYRLSLSFTPAGEATVSGKSYPAYNISSNSKYLSYDENGKLVAADKAGDNTLFAIIPYTDVVPKASDEFKNGYLLYAVNAPGSAKYFSADSNSNNASVSLTATPEKDKLTCMHLSNYNSKKAEAFEGLLCTQYVQNGESVEHTGSLYRFSFIYWDKDISVGMPELSVEVAVSSVDRQNLYITLHRTDKNGVQEVFSPASMDLRVKDRVLPGLDIPSESQVSFSGKINPTEAETGYFTFGFSTLCSFNGKYSMDDFLWGINVKGSGVKVKSIKFLDKDRNIISQITLPEDTPELTQGEVAQYVFKRGNELKSYFGSGSYKLKSVGTGKILSLSSNNMTFAWSDGKAQNEEKTHFRVEYNKEDDTYLFWNYKDTYVLDIFGTDVKDGVLAKLNAPNIKRNTQSWTVSIDANGYLRLSLKNYPGYSFGYNGKDFCVSENGSSDNYLWQLVPVNDSDVTANLKCEGRKVTLTGNAPADYTAGKIQMKVIKDGVVVSTVDMTGDKKQGFTVTAEFEAGTYLFCMVCDGKEYGTRILYEVK